MESQTVLVRDVFNKFWLPFGLGRSTSPRGQSTAEDPDVDLVICEAFREIFENAVELQSCLKYTEFLETWVLSRLVAEQDTPLRYAPLPEDITAVEAVETIKATIQENHELMRATTAFLGHVVRHMQHVQTLDGPQIKPQMWKLELLERIYSPESRCKRDRSLRILVSNWVEFKPAQSVKELVETRVLSSRSIRTHCEDWPVPTDWISLVDDVRWVLQNIDHSRFCGSNGAQVYVAFISIARLKAFNVLFDRSDLLVHAVKRTSIRYKNPKGVKFVWPGHYLAYGWIPEQCVMFDATAEQFVTACDNKNVTEDVDFFPKADVLLRELQEMNEEKGDGSEFADLSDDEDLRELQEMDEEMDDGSEVADLDEDMASEKLS